MEGAGVGDRVSATGRAGAGPWVPLASVAPGRRSLARPVTMVGTAVVMLLVGWWAASGAPDPSDPSADRATLVMWTSPVGAAIFFTMAAGRFLVSMQAVAALYGRTRAHGVEVAGLTGRFGWLPGRHLLVPGQAFLHVGVGGPGVMPWHHIRLAQGRRSLTVTADSWWDDATVPSIVSWLGRHGIQAVPFPGVPGPGAGGGTSTGARP